MSLRSSTVGAFEMLVRVKNRISNLFDAPLIVLLYHRITDLPSDPQMLAITPENFRSQMIFLKKNFSMVKLGSRPGAISRPAVAVTFDDGYADNCHHALPILEELEIPATFFISTGYIAGNSEFWWDEAERILLEQPELPSFLELPYPTKPFPTFTYEQRLSSYRQLLLIMKKLDAFQREELLRFLQDWSGTEAKVRPTHRPLNLEELRLLADSPWASVGAHGVSHTPLSSISPERQREEINHSKKWLEELTGKKVQLFSYPLGTKYDYTAKTVSLCREAGFVQAASNFPGQVHRWTDPFQLPRHLVRNWPLEMFRKHMQVFWTL